jgi:hypothetical protein
VNGDSTLQHHLSDLTQPSPAPPGEEPAKTREFRLHGAPCVVCGYPALSLIPGFGVRHDDFICPITPCAASAQHRATSRARWQHPANRRRPRRRRQKTRGQHRGR